MNFFNVKVEGSQIIFEDGTKIEAPEGVVKQLGTPSECVLGIRPEHVSIDKVALDAFPHQVMTSEIINLERMGNENHVFMKVGSSDVILKVPSRMTEGLGDKLEFMVDINKCHFFNKETEQRIF